ncbi:hypothetical protein CEXT_278051 [Caerostris extrusa]|uniref:Uncharacterized protein n=1 Tax=Caerostris extrusa TaxID=172846 RepID=A0AAV4VK00_CAEEX|nr:hypothetical protein CEXT_278051 [Caerostris extrusa]
MLSPFVEKSAFLQQVLGRGGREGFIVYYPPYDSPILPLHFAMRTSKDLGFPHLMKELYGLLIYFRMVWNAVAQHWLDGNVRVQKSPYRDVHAGIAAIGAVAPSGRKGCSFRSVTQPSYSHGFVVRLATALVLDLKTALPALCVPRERWAISHGHCHPAPDRKAAPMASMSRPKLVPILDIPGHVSSEYQFQVWISGASCIQLEDSGPASGGAVTHYMLIL